MMYDKEKNDSIYSSYTVKFSAHCLQISKTPTPKRALWGDFYTILRRLLCPKHRCPIILYYVHRYLLSEKAKEQVGGGRKFWKIHMQ